MKKILLFLALAGCGFQPMFSGQDTDIYVAPISGINGIEMRNQLNANFGGQKMPDAKYSLVVTLQDPVTQYKGLELSGAASWQEVSIRASYVLTSDGLEIARGVETAAESYTFVGYLVASNASYNNAVKNTITVLADKIGTRAIAATANYSTQKASDTDNQ